MRALLDENMPKALVRLFAPEVATHTVQQEGWSGLKNGTRLTLAADSFERFITTDQGIPHQQNLSRYDIAIVLLAARSNRSFWKNEFYNSLAPPRPNCNSESSSSSCYWRARQAR